MADKFLCLVISLENVCIKPMCLVCLLNDQNFVLFPKIIDMLFRSEIQSMFFRAE